MANKSISELTRADTIYANDLFVLEQSDTTKSLTGQMLINWLTAMADGHGGVSTITYTAAPEGSLMASMVVTLADGTTSTIPVYNGAKGDRGEPGATGATGSAASVTSQSRTYQVSSSGTTIPTGTWSSTIPAVSAGEYLWSRLEITWSDTTVTTLYAVGYAGQNGSGSGTVTAVNNVQPDAGGNVTLTASDVGALASSGTAANASALDGHLASYFGTASDVSTNTQNIATNAAAISGIQNAKGAASGYASLDANTKVTAAEASSRIVEVTESKTIALTDAGTFQYCTGSTAKTITIPANASVGFPVGTEIEICRYGSGTVTIAGASGVTIVSVDSKAAVADQYGCAGLKKIATNVWILAGDLG